MPLDSYCELHFLYNLDNYYLQYRLDVVAIGHWTVIPTCQGMDFHAFLKSVQKYLKRRPKTCAKYLRGGKRLILFVHSAIKLCGVYYILPLKFCISIGGAHSDMVCAGKDFL